MSSYFKVMCDTLHISYDRFISSTDDDHKIACQALWKGMVARGDIYLGRYEGWYSVRDEAFYDEKELTKGEGEQRLSPQGTPVEWTVEESWFFRLSAYQDKLLELYRSHPEFIQPESRRNEVIRFVEGGLSDLSVSRTSFDWGIAVPDSPGHVMYVWVDALTNYLTGIGYPALDGTLGRFWPADVHVIGKDIVRFHAVYWPAFLMSADVPLPKQVFGHGFLLHKGEKMSKSVGNVVDPIELASVFGVDQLRYFLLREVSFGQDGSYSEDAIVTRCNADLANNLGNLAQRSLSMIAKNCGGKVPQPHDASAADTALLAGIAAVEQVARQHMMGGQYAIHHALQAIWEQMSLTNQYFAEQQPWAVRKTDPARADTILYYTAEAIRQLAILARWVMPVSCDKLLDILAQSPDARDFAALGQQLEPGIDLPPPAPIFPRLELAADAKAD
jgi:methionyl-tRNA synthetase